MKIYKIALVPLENIRTLYHISNKLFKKFDITHSTDGAIWFAKDKNSLISNRHGASIGKGNIFLYTCNVKSNKTAGWNEYEKLNIDQLIQEKYDSIDLDEDFVSLSPENIDIIKVEKI